ncbi:ABC transporter permease [Dactylosporangium sp. NPDC000555]|uniref:ABC transporter permease n=1 Tax=Dactylosporangium sp. NPDC000555 TaxID=3154260 RepID=UPI00331D84B3
MITAAVTVALGAAISAAADCVRDGCGADATRLALSGVYLGQAPVAVLAVLAVSGEYSTTLIRTTVTAIPSRPVVLAAKALVLAVTVAAAASLTQLAAVLVAGTLLPRLSLVDGPVLRAIGSVAYLVLIALLSLGTAAAVRDSGAAIGTVLGLLYLPPILAQMVTEPQWHRLFEHIAPMTAGKGVLAAWACGTLLIGGLLLRFRDVQA